MKDCGCEDGTTEECEFLIAMLGSNGQGITVYDDDNGKIINIYCREDAQTLHRLGIKFKI